MQIKRALISVYDKTNLLELAKFLQDNKIEIVSSGGTANYLKEHNIPVISVEELTEWPEMLSGRVKTLHPAIHAGILYIRQNPEHEKSVKEHNLKSIDLVIVNLYPFQKTIDQPNNTLEQAIEQIDIGGPSLIRAAAKNHESVIVLSSINQYEDFKQAFLARQLNTQKSLEYAIKAFEETAHYDQVISGYLSSQNNNSVNKINLNLNLEQALRYGENPHQKANLYSIPNQKNIIQSIKQLSGKELSYNNWLDMDSAWNLINEFEPEIPACAIVKHNSPCGVALGETVTEAFDYALECDPVSAFGGIVILNQEIDLEVAKKMQAIFLEVIMAPSFSDEAFQLLSQKKNLRLIKIPLDHEINSAVYKSIFANGLLVQSPDNSLFNSDNMKVVTETQPSEEDWLSSLFALRIVKHIRSNGIVIVNGNRSVGLCGGQTNRVNSVKIALEQASDLSTNGILASDAFFPFADNIEYCAQGRIKTIIQPGGSIRDQEVIDTANKYKIAMIFTSIRHFKH